MDALDHDDLVLPELKRAVVRNGGARFEVEAGHGDLLPCREALEVARQAFEVHALRTFEVGHAVFIVHRLVVLGRGAVVVVHGQHFRVHAGKLHDTRDAVVRGGLARGRRAVYQHNRTAHMVAHDLVRRHVDLAVVVLLAVVDKRRRVAFRAVVDVSYRVFRHNTPSLH